MLEISGRVACLSAMLAVSAIAAPAAAQAPEIVVTAKPPPDLMRRVVKTSDLDLNTPDGQRELKRRVETAVDSLCSIPSPIGYYERIMNQPCRKEAWANAKPQVDRQLARSQPRDRSR